MYKKITETEKSEIISQYLGGQAVTTLSSEYGIPRSTIYSWIKNYRALRSSTDTNVCYLDYCNLKRRADKLEQILSVIKVAGCSTDAPLQEKLKALEKLYGQYSVYVLCEALDVSRGTFYNHIFRKTDVTWYEKRRIELKEEIMTAFNEREQRYGAPKINAVLAQKGIKTSPRYVSELMKEMEISSISTDSKRIYKNNLKRQRRDNSLNRQFNVSTPNRVDCSTHF